MTPATFYLGLFPAANFGWGIASRYISSELSKLTAVKLLDVVEPPPATLTEVDGPVFQALPDQYLTALFPYRGSTNFGYTFFEALPTPEAVQQAKLFDRIFVGSKWCGDQLNRAGIQNTTVLHQGVDKRVFFSGAPRTDDERFVVFSGGKFEFRKGQDLVLKAFKIFNSKHPESVLVTSWYNYIPTGPTTMEQSNHISVSRSLSVLKSSQSTPVSNQTWKHFINSLLAENGLTPNQVIVHEQIPHEQLRDIYLDSDVGLFPNRCEGGTNLVLMEYMACGRAAIVSATSGHLDVIDETTTLQLRHLTECPIHEDGKIVAHWEEAAIDEIVEQLEFAYQNRAILRERGMAAGQSMSLFSWERCAEIIMASL